VPRSRADVYLRRGRNLLLVVERAEADKNWDGAAVTGVQAAIAYADAFTISKLGLRSRGQDHAEVVPLIARVGSENSANLATDVQKVLNRKSAVEYGDRQVSADDSRTISRDLRNIARIVESELQ
jgi:hypothetical protein